MNRVIENARLVSFAIKFIRQGLETRSNCEAFRVEPAKLIASALREPSQWLSKVNEKGQIFELQLDNVPIDGQHESSTDVECLCTCSDCATDDTGYGTDTDLHVSPGKNFKADESIESDYLQNQKLVFDFNEIDEVFCGESFGLSDASSAASHTGNSNIAEENIDSLFASVNLNNESGGLFDGLLLENDFALPDNINSFFETKKKTKLGVNDLIYSELDHDIGMMPHMDTKTNLTKDDIPPLSGRSKSASGSKQCHCSGKVKSPNHERHKIEHAFSVVVRLKSMRLKEPCRNTLELCERILGIVPGHFGSSQSSKHRRRDRRVKIRSIVPTGVVAKYPDIHLGDCLWSINDQEVTWDNLDSVLQVLLLQKQAKLTVHQINRQNDGSLVLKRRTQSRSEQLVHLVSGSHDSAVSLEDFNNSSWEPFYGAMYLSLDGVSSENMQEKDDIVYQFPRRDNGVVNARGIFITLAGTVSDATGSTIHSTTMLVDNQPVHVVYHCEGSDLFVISAPEARFSLPYLELLVKELIRLLQVLHGSVHNAFSLSTNHKQLDCFFALLHESQISQAKHSDTVQKHSISQSVQLLPLPSEIKVLSDSVLTEFEAADFGDMSDSYYGCRRSYSILGSCLFYKNYLINNHLPKEDLVDFATYLKHHSLLTLASDQSIGQLVVWREVFPTRHCHSVGEEQTFGYTEPLVARWFWLIIGYKHLMMCVLLETGGCTAVQGGIATPDPFLIDQARAVLLQLDGQDIPLSCQTSISNQECPPCANPDIFRHHKNKLDILTRRSSKTACNETPHHVEVEGLGSVGKTLSRNRKDSLCSDNSSESSGSDSIFKFSRRGRLFPEACDSLQNITESKEDVTGPINTRRKLTAGVENCLFCFQYYDNLDGVFISSDMDTSRSSPLTREVYNNFHQCCEKIKKLFDHGRKIKEQRKDGKDHVFGLNKDLCAIREEGVRFTVCSPSDGDKKLESLSYWVVGRCLSRSFRREVYVCFQESTPQKVIELAFKLALGCLPL